VRNIGVGLSAAFFAAFLLYPPPFAAAQDVLPPPETEPAPALPPIEGAPELPPNKGMPELPPPETHDAGGGSPGLPAAPGRIGRIRRGADGKLAPDGPALPPDSGSVGTGYPSLPPAVGGAPMTRETRPATIPALRVYDPRVLDTVRSRTAHEFTAKRRQIEIDKVIREEKDAKDNGAPANKDGLTARELELLRDLERTDRTVRDHEMADYFAAQPHAAFPEYWFVRDPNGQRYAVTGMTKFDASEIEGDVQGTIRKLEQLRRAALTGPAVDEEDRRTVAALDRLIEQLRSRPSPDAQRTRPGVPPGSTTPNAGRGVRLNSAPSPTP
jgi:hypothetical protein